MRERRKKEGVADFYLKVKCQTLIFPRFFFSVIEEMDTTCQRTPQKRRGAISAEVYTEEEVSLGSKTGNDQ